MITAPRIFLQTVALLFCFAAVYAQPFSMGETQAEDVYSQALNYYSDGNLEQAQQLLKYLIANNYNDRYVYYTLMDVYAQKISHLQSEGKNADKIYFDVVSEAKKTAGEGIRLYPEDKKLLYRYSDFSRNLGDTQEFTQSLKTILKLDDEDIFANYWMGAYLFLNKEYDKSTGFFQKVISVPYSKRDEFELMAVYRSCYNLGVIANNAQNYKLAVQYLEKAKSMYSRDTDLIRYLAFTYAEMLEPEKAIENFEQIPEMFRGEDIASVYAGVLFLKNDPKLNGLILEYQDESHYINAIRFYRKGDYSNSLVQIDEHVLKNNFADFYSHYLLYQDYRALGDREKAGQQAFLIANRAKEVGKLDLAIRFYKAVEDNTNAIPEIYWLIGSLYDDSENIRNAEIYYEKYLSHKDSGEYRVPALVRLSYLYYKSGDKKRSRESIENAKKSAVKKEDLYQVYYYSGLMNLELRNYRGAIADFQGAIKSQVKDARLYYYMATAQFEANKRNDAITSLEQARETEKSSPEINNLLAYLYSLEKTKLDDALMLVNLALIASPDNIAYLDTQGWIYFEKNDYKRSYEIFQNVLRLMGANQYTADDGFDEIYYHLGMVHEKFGKKDEAKKFYRKGYKLNPKNVLLKKKVK